MSSHTVHYTSLDGRPMVRTFKTAKAAQTFRRRLGGQVRDQSKCTACARAKARARRRDARRGRLLRALSRAR